ncbi:hypothetical protein F4604DRAFT_1892238 [Suillus subluteus]|nr:hypothetical protein F4604DRAFT_1892238 [Suillus subluteus]
MSRTHEFTDATFISSLAHAIDVLQLAGIKVFKLEHQLEPLSQVSTASLLRFLLIACCLCQLALFGFILYVSNSPRVT